MTGSEAAPSCRYAIITVCLMVFVSLSGYGQSYTYEKTIGSRGSADGQFSLVQSKVATDDAGNIYVVDCGRDQLVVFNSGGQFTGYFGAHQLNYPTAVSIDAAGRVYITSLYTLYIFDRAGTLLKRIPVSDCWAVTTDAAGNIYVAAGVAGDIPRIKVFNPQGTLVREFGSLGSGKGQLYKPMCLAIDNQAGRLYVANAGNDRIEVFALDGTYVSQIGNTEGTEPGQFNYPSSIALDAVGNLYVADSQNNRVQVFNSAGSFAYTFGTIGTGNYEFFGLSGIHLDVLGRVYVSDVSNFRVQVYTKAPNAIEDFSDLTRTYGDAPFTLSAHSSSGALVTYEALSDPAYTGRVTIAGKLVSIQQAGTVRVRASAGDDLVHAGATKDITITINKSPQTLTFPALPPRSHGDAPFTLSATASSQLGVSYASSNPAVATVSGSVVTIVGSGTATITATQAGNENFLAALPVSQTLIVKSSQSISMRLPAAIMYGQAATTLPSATSAGLPITYASSNTRVVTTTGNLLTPKGQGSATITATQAGNDYYEPATATAGVIVRASIPVTKDSRLDFGQVVTLASSTLNVTIFNKGDTTLTIQSITCPARFSTTATSIRLEAGEQYTFPVTFTPARELTYSGAIAIKVNPSPGVFANTVYVDVTGQGVAKAAAPKTSAPFELYPNPTSDVVTIRGAVDPQSTVTITDHMGYTKIASAINTLSGNTYSIDISSLPAGLYYLNIKGPDGRSWVKQIVKN